MKTNRKIALVSGASRGIGAAIAVGLCEDGFDIWLNYRSDHEKALKVKKDIEEKGRECLLLPFDVSDDANVCEILQPLLEKEVPYAFVSNAGFTRDGVLGLMTEEMWKSVIDVNLNGFFSIAHRIVPHMQRKRQGRIVTIASASGETGLPGQANYSAAKAGLIGVTKALAKELGKRNILVNAVSPGLIATSLTESLPLEQFLSHIPLGRIGTADDVANCVRFLCSEKAAYITGQVLSVNGGLYM